MLQKAQIIKHELSVGFTCDKCKKDIRIRIDNPSIYTGNYYEDWEYKYIYVNCPFCNESHRLEV